MSESLQEQIIYDRLISELKAYIAKQNTLTINSIDIKLSIDNFHCCNEHLTLTLNHEYIDKILIWPDTHINFEVIFKDSSNFLYKNKRFTQDLDTVILSYFILNVEHNSTIDDVLNMINVIFNDNSKIESILQKVTQVILF